MKIWLVFLYRAAVLSLLAAAVYPDMLDSRVNFMTAFYLLGIVAAGLIGYVPDTAGADTHASSV